MLFSENQPCPLLYSITPPRRDQTPEAIAKIAAIQMARTHSLDIQGLILYDIQDEKNRTPLERPFPFLPTMDPYDYAETYLKDLDLPRIIYRCVGKHTKEDFAKWLEVLRGKPYSAVFVGAASRLESNSLTLTDAYALRNQVHPELRLGGVAIPERHNLRPSEHIRLLDKEVHGCSFFVTQAVYDVQISKDLLSDYYYGLPVNHRPAPLIFTFSICGSQKTLAFMKWLGVKFPRWIENELNHTNDTIDLSITMCLHAIKELIEFSRAKGLPIGFNIESVSIRKEEIDASIELARATRTIIKSFR